MTKSRKTDSSLAMIQRSADGCPQLLAAQSYGCAHSPTGLRLEPLAWFGGVVWTSYEGTSKKSAPSGTNSIRALLVGVLLRTPRTRHAAVFNPLNFGQAYGIHVVLLPVTLVALVAIHIVLVRLKGVVRPIGAPPPGAPPAAAGSGSGVRERADG